MWSEGYISVKDTICLYWVKHFEEPSEYGIEGGRISKLTIKVGDQVTANYDRGWDIEPEDEATKSAYKTLVAWMN